MFTGIIEHLGTVESLERHAEGGRLTIQAPSVAPHLAVANSIAVDGCCLTVRTVRGDKFSADLSSETIRKTAMDEWKSGTRVNLEQPLTAAKEFGGHFVLGHVDTIGRVAHLTRSGEAWDFGIHVPKELAPFVVNKGSLAIDGISLTIANWSGSIAEIAVIPYTYQHTNVAD